MFLCTVLYLPTVLSYDYKYYSVVVTLHYKRNGKFPVSNFATAGANPYRTFLGLARSHQANTRRHATTVSRRKVIGSFHAHVLLVSAQRFYERLVNNHKQKWKVWNRPKSGLVSCRKSDGLMAPHCTLRQYYRARICIRRTGGIRYRCMIYINMYFRIRVYALRTFHIEQTTVHCFPIEFYRSTATI